MQMSTANTNENQAARPVRRKRSSLLLNLMKSIGLGGLSWIIFITAEKGALSGTGPSPMDGGSIPIFVPFICLYKCMYRIAKLIYRPIAMSWQYVRRQTLVFSTLIESDDELSDVD